MAEGRPTDNGDGDFLPLGGANGRRRKGHHRGEKREEDKIPIAWLHFGYLCNLHVRWQMNASSEKKRPSSIFSMILLEMARSLATHIQQRSPRRTEA